MKEMNIFEIIIFNLRIKKTKVKIKILDVVNRVKYRRIRSMIKTVSSELDIANKYLTKPMKINVVQPFEKDDAWKIMIQGSSHDGGFKSYCVSGDITKENIKKKTERIAFAEMLVRKYVSEVETRYLANEDEE